VPGSKMLLVTVVGVMLSADDLECVYVVLLCFERIAARSANSESSEQERSFRG
jgi:hypothetical protein